MKVDAQIAQSVIEPEGMHPICAKRRKSVRATAVGEAGDWKVPHGGALCRIMASDRGRVTSGDEIVDLPRPQVL